MKQHTWTVVLSDDTQGFTKTVQVNAHGFSQAVTFAGDQLVRRGYRREQFAVVKLARGHETRREAA